MKKNWMSVAEIADYLGMSSSTIYQHIAKRQIPFSKVPHSSLIRFDQERIDKWLKDNTFETMKEALKGGNASAQSTPSRRHGRQIRTRLHR